MTKINSRLTSKEAHIPRIHYAKINDILSVKSNVYEVIREGILAGFTNSFIAFHLNVKENLIRICRDKMRSENLISKNTYGSRINEYKPVTRYKMNSKGKMIEVPHEYSKSWNLGPSDRIVDPTTFKLPIVCKEDILRKGKPVEKYIGFNDMWDGVKENTQEPIEETMDLFPQEIKVYPVTPTEALFAAPIDNRTDFVGLTERVLTKSQVSKVYIPPIVLKPVKREIPKLEPINKVMTQTQTGQGTTFPTSITTDVPKKPVTITIHGIKFTLNLQTTEVIITDSGIEIK